MIDFTGVIGMINYNYELSRDNHNRYVAYVDDHRPCLWKPTVVEGLLRKKLNIIVEALCQLLKGKDCLYVQSYGDYCQRAAGHFLWAKPALQVINME